MANTAPQAFLDGVAAHLLGPPAQLVPHHAAPRGHGAARSRTSPSGPTTCSARCDRQVAATRDPRLRALLDEVSALPERRRAATRRGGRATASPAVVVPLRLRGRRRRVQSWFSTNTSIGTPVDITLDELHVELFHPADEATAAHGRRAHGLTSIGPCDDGARSRPAATDEEAAAIAAAIEALWPRPVVGADGDRSAGRRCGGSAGAGGASRSRCAGPAPGSDGDAGRGRRADHRRRRRRHVPRRHDRRPRRRTSSPAPSTSATASRSARSPARRAGCAAASAPSTTSTSARSRPAASTTSPTGPIRRAAARRRRRTRRR